MSDVEGKLLLVVLLVKLGDLKIGVYDPIRSVLASQGCEGADIPFLCLPGGNVVWTTPAVVAVIVNIQIVSIRHLLSKVGNARDYDE